MIKFHSLSKTWPDGTKALSDVTLEVPRGQFCVILGPSGAGKSTLLRAVNGLMKPSTGHVSIDGVTLSSSTERELRKRVAMIHQHFNLTGRMSVAANVLAGLLPIANAASLTRTASSGVAAKVPSPMLIVRVEVDWSPSPSRIV